jgi:hypothetical protein
MVVFFLELEAMVTLLLVDSVHVDDAQAITPSSGRG